MCLHYGQTTLKKMGRNCVKKLRVVVLGTGNVSSYSVKAITGRPDMEIVGVWAHKETAGDWIGKDAGHCMGGPARLVWLSLGR
jgi:hypothetical protein